MGYLSTERVGEHWDLKDATVRRMIASGTLAAEKFEREWRIEWDDVWAQEQGPRPVGQMVSRYQKPLLSRAALAAEFDVCIRTVDRWIRQGMPTRNVGTNVRVNLDDARGWLAARYGWALGRPRRKPKKR